MRLCRWVVVGALLWSAGASAAPLFERTSDAEARDRATNGVAERLAENRSTRRLELIQVNPLALREETLELPLDQGSAVQAKRRKLIRRAPNNVTWQGDIPGGTAMFVMRGQKLTGSIRRGSTLYRIVPLDAGGHALIEVDQSALPEEEPPSMRDSGRPIPKKQSGGDAAATADTAPVLDVMVVYTSAAASRTGDIQGLIQLAVDETNQGYQNSNVNLRVNLAHVYGVDYREGTRSYDTMMRHLLGKSDGFMDEIHSLRDQHGADVVLMIVNQDDYCGMAETIMAQEDEAFAIVHWDCAIGYYSFGHEIGHLQGARHDQGTDNSTQPFAYGHGYRYRQLWRTIMSYDCSNGCPRLLYWSNPNVSYNGVPMGVASTANNARVLNETVSIVTAFRSGGVTPGPTGGVFRFTGAVCAGDVCPGWEQIGDVSGELAAASAEGSQALYQRRDDGSIWAYPGGTCQSGNCPDWVKLSAAGPTMDIVAGGASLYRLDEGGVVQRYTGTPCSGNSCPGWDRLGKSTSITALAASASTVYQLRGTSGIFELVGGTWRKISNAGKVSAIVANDGSLYRLQSTGILSRYTGTPCITNSNCPGWERIDKRAGIVEIAAGGTALYQRHTNGEVRRYTGTPCNGSTCAGWQLLDNNAKTQALAAGGANLYQRHDDGSLWRYTGTPCSGGVCNGWQRIDVTRQPVPGFAASAGALYQDR